MKIKNDKKKSLAQILDEESKRQDENIDIFLYLHYNKKQLFNQ